MSVYMSSNSDNRVLCTPCLYKALPILLWLITPNALEMSRKVMYSGSVLSFASVKISVIIIAANNGEHAGENPNCRLLCAVSRMGFAYT